MNKRWYNENASNETQEDSGDGAKAVVCGLFDKPHNDEHHYQRVDGGEDSSVRQLDNENNLYILVIIIYFVCFTRDKQLWNLC